MKKDATIIAVNAHSDMSVLGAVVSILEGGHLYTPRATRAADRIIRICQDEMLRQYRDYNDAACRIAAGK